MRGIILFTLAILSLSGCVNKHPYEYKISEDLSKIDIYSANWYLEKIQNESSIPMTEQKQADLTSRIDGYLKSEGFNIQQANQLPQGDCLNCFLIKPKIIQVMAKISQNEAGWHGTSEDPLNFWSHFSPGSGMQFVEGAAPALSLYVEIYSNGQKQFENAGGIELVGKYNKFSFRTTDKKELVEDPERFQKAMEIAFRPLIETGK